ncbi:MAG: glucose-6-phosphate dehydrogenase assembly protein OpcA [Roseiflexaceae bacterium]
MTTNTLSTPLGERTRIDVRAIERELTALWKQAAEDQDEGGQAVTRTCVLNLLVATTGGRALAEATATIARLTARHPNRAIVISAVPAVANPGAIHEPPLLDAWVQAHCQMPGPGRPQVCCEQITIEARGTAIAHVPGTVLPLLVPDLPVMFWWPRGASFDDPLFARLCDLADRVIVDSATSAAPEAALPRLTTLLDARIAVSDMAWARLTPWRELIAQFFDAPAMLPHLATVERVVVEYEASAGTTEDRTQAFLLVGWLGSRLGWRPAGPLQRAGDATRLALARPDGVVVQAELRPVAPQDDLLDRLASFTLECPRGRFSVSRTDAPDAAETHMDVVGMQPLQRIVRLQRLDEAGLLAEEIQLLGHDHGFEGALRLATELLARASEPE